MRSRHRDLVLTASLVIIAACIGAAAQRLSGMSVGSAGALPPPQSRTGAANPKDWLVIPLDQMK
jgi:hypothetical protein